MFAVHFFGLPLNKVLNKQQRNQYYAATLVTWSNLFQHVSPILHSFRWLTISKANEYRTINKAPNYYGQMFPGIHSRTPNDMFQITDSTING